MNKIVEHSPRMILPPLVRIQDLLALSTINLLWELLEDLNWPKDIKLNVKNLYLIFALNIFAEYSDSILKWINPNRGKLIPKYLVPWLLSLECINITIWWKKIFSSALLFQENSAIMTTIRLIWLQNMPAGKIMGFMKVVCLCP